MQFKAITLEILSQKVSLCCLLHRSRRDGIAKDGKPAMLLPVFSESTLDAVRDAWRVETQSFFLGIRCLWNEQTDGG
jgi:hypothetical protein